jgi:hypothetical protein
MDKKYKAFISYSHKDSEFAMWLHKKLESWSVPKDLVNRATNIGNVPRTLRPIFRDRDDFSGGHSLKEATLKALDESEFLIVLCSPKAAKSSYVAEEVRQFKLMGKADRVIPVILAGEPGDSEQECFPVTIKYTLDENGELSDELAEPIAPDARDKGDGKSRALAKVVAGLLGVTFDDIIKREDISRKRRLSVASGLGSGAFIFAVLLSSYALYENYQAELTINKSIFSIGSLIAKTDELSNVDDLIEKKRSMLRAQCDVQAGLASGRAQVDRLSHSICLAQQANAKAQIGEIDEARQSLNAWLNKLSLLYSSNERQGMLNKTDANAYVRAAVEIYKFVFKYGHQEQRQNSLEQLELVSYRVGSRVPSLTYAYTVHDTAFWNLFEILEGKQAWEQLVVLFNKTIILRKAQATAYQYDDFNSARLDTAILLKTLAQIQFTQFEDQDAALRSITDAKSNVTMVQNEIEINESLYEVFQIYTLLAEIQRTQNKLALAIESDEIAKSFLSNILADDEIPEKVRHQIEQERAIINARLSQ